MMDADQIRKALFPHEETIKRLQAENEVLRAMVDALESAKPVEKPKEKKRGGDTREES
jgi:hypothetical protein